MKDNTESKCEWQGEWHALDGWIHSPDKSAMWSNSSSGQGVPKIPKKTLWNLGQESVWAIWSVWKPQPNKQGWVLLPNLEWVHQWLHKARRWLRGGANPRSGVEEAYLSSSDWSWRSIWMTDMYRFSLFAKRPLTLYSGRFEINVLYAVFCAIAAPTCSG